MKKALVQAKKAYDNQEVPIGAVIVVDNKVVAKAYNKRNASKNATHHAEIMAIAKACKALGDWRLENAELYVTLMPCPMCAGAIVNARIKKVFFGADNGNREIFEKIMQESELNHKTEFEGGVLAEECSNLLKSFFASKRNK